MIKLRYSVRTDWLFYLFVLSYSYLVISMTVSLWFGGGVNIFASYSEAATIDEIIVDANKVYWSKTTFLFLTLFLYSFRLDYRFVAGLGATFWSLSLILMFGTTQNLIIAAFIGVGLIVQQIWRKQILSAKQ
ncbi:MAG: hypothetical protein AAF629_20710 [Chloroflexota bacterium]